MVLLPNGARPSVPVSLGNHEARLRALERLVSGGWRFNFDNEGGWGYVQFNDSFDLDAMPDPLSVGGTWSAAFEEAGGDGFLIGSTTLLFLKSDGTFAVQATTSPIVFTVNGKSFEFRDDGSIHGPIGGNVVFDL